MMQTVESVENWKSLKINGSLGFVPTMGALHNGHLSLVKQSVKENKSTVVSIFVNPTQFNDSNDYQNYPKTWEEDISKLRDLGVNYVFAPKYQELYHDDYRYQICENNVSKLLCGAHRPGHFTGMLTVVMKLLLIIRPDHAYFGKKDYQQYLLVKDMAAAFFLDTKIIGCQIIREEDKLAMSSRNLLLTQEHRKKAPEFHKLLTTTNTSQEAKQALEQRGFKVDYVEDLWRRRLAAVHLGDVRLIDNIALG